MGPGNLQDMKEYAKYYKSKGIDCICDPGQSLPAWNAKDFEEWISGSAMLISNDYELELISRMTGKAKKELFSFTKTIITTLGEKGSIISTPGGDINISPAKVSKVLDPTGAGDAYRSGLLKGLITGKDIETSARIGSVAATYAIEKHGTQEHHFSYEDFCERYRDNYGLEL
jgi:adenosine kinase